MKRLACLALMLVAAAASAQPITSEQLRVIPRSVWDARKAPGAIAPSLARGIAVALVAELPGSTRAVTLEDLAPLGLSVDEALEQGRRNVERALGPVAGKARRDEQGFYVLTGHDYEASRMLLHESWAELAREWKSALAVMVPEARTLLYAPSSDTAALEAMLREGNRRYTGERRIHNNLYHWTRSGWTSYRIPGAATAAPLRREPEPLPLNLLSDAAGMLLTEYVDDIDLAGRAGKCEPRIAAWLRKFLERDARPGFSPADAGYASHAEMRTPVHECINAIARTLDRATELYYGEGVREMTLGGAGASVGLTLEHGDPYPRVLSVARPGPGADAGIRVSDEIVSVEGVSTTGMASWVAGERMRGHPGSSVRMTLRRAGQEREVTVAREVLGERQPSVKARPGGGVLVARPAMTDGSALRLAQALADARPAGVILDLRSHPGGLLSEAIAVAAIFLRPTDIVGRLQGREEAQVLRADRGWRPVEEVQRVSASLKSVPLVVLADEETAAGAELVVGALQGGKRARVVGRTTRGVGTVATLIPMGVDYILKVTTGRMVTPDGRRFDGQGLTPDLRVEATDDEQQLQAAERALAGAK